MPAERTAAKKWEIPIIQRPRLNHSEGADLNTRPRASREPDVKEAAIQSPSFPRNTSLGPGSFAGEFCQAFREGLIPVLLKPSQRTEGGTLLNTVSEASIILMLKPDHDATHKKENYRPVSLMNISIKVLNEILAN